MTSKKRLAAADIESGHPTTVPSASSKPVDSSSETDASTADVRGATELICYSHLSNTSIRKRNPNQSLVAWCLVGVVKTICGFLASFFLFPSRAGFDDTVVLALSLELC
jgi:hypothetical protein